VAYVAAAILTLALVGVLVRPRFSLE